MASGDIKGDKVKKAMADAYDRARKNEEVESEQQSNIVVGEFLSELATAIKFRMKLGQSLGDWIEEPERFFTDGLIFAVEEASAASVKLQVTLSLDASTSMWANGIMRHAGPAFIALDRIIRKSMQDLPEGSIHYAPFVFHQKAFEVPAAFLNQFVGRVDFKTREAKSYESVWNYFPTRDNWARAVELGQLPKDARYSDYPMSGEDTLIAPLFRAIQEWEQTKGDPSATRLDIVITDGVLENAGDVEEATKVQEERNGKLRTTLLNFLPLNQWSNYQLPDRCSQFAVTADDLDSSIRNILQDAIGDLFA